MTTQQWGGRLAVTSWAVGLLALGLATAAGCSEDETQPSPSSSGGSSAVGGSGQGGESQGGGGDGGGPGGSGGDGGAGPCRKCSQVYPNGDPADLCSDNGPPSSETLYESLNDCICVDECASQCGNNACQGGQPAGPCNGCIAQNCTDELDDCLADL